ncbi:hypothetical protein H8959_016006, partial [Pygathrix nigripes]
MYQEPPAAIQGVPLPGLETSTSLQWRTRGPAAQKERPRPAEDWPRKVPGLPSPRHLRELSREGEESRGTGERRRKACGEEITCVKCSAQSLLLTTYARRFLSDDHEKYPKLLREQEQMLPLTVPGEAGRGAQPDSTFTGIMFRKKKKKRPEISAPQNFQHRVHTSFDPKEGKFVGLPPQWQNILDTLRRPKPVVDPSRITRVQLQPMKTVVRGSAVPVDGYISGLLNDIQKLSVISSNTLRGRSPTSRRRAQSLGLLGDEHWATDPDMYLQSPQSERTDPHGLYLSCNGGTPAGHKQMPWPEPQSPQVLPNGLAAKAQSLGPAEFQGASQRCLQLGACLQSSPPGASPPTATGRRGMKAAKHGCEEARPQSCLVGSAMGRPGGEGSPSPKTQESSLKRRLFRSMFLSTAATAPPSSSKPGPPPQSKPNSSFRPPQKDNPPSLVAKAQSLPSDQPVGTFSPLTTSDTSSPQKSLRTAAAAGPLPGRSSPAGSPRTWHAQIS